MAKQHLQSFALLISLIAIGTWKFLSVSTYSVNRFGDVLIRNDGETFQCDRIVCPPGSVRCQVTKSPDDSDPNITIRRNICFGRNGQILMQNSSRERLPGNQGQQLNVVVSDDGYSSSIISGGGGQTYYGSNPIDSEALTQSIHENVQRTLDEVNRNLEESLGGLWHGFN